MVWFGKKVGGGAGQHGFSAKRTTVFTVTDTSGVLTPSFDNEFFDDGGNFDGTTYTAPADGVYLFTYNMEFEHEQQQGWLYASSGGTFCRLSGRTPSCSGIIQLSAGDTVVARHRMNSNEHSSQYALNNLMISGVMISE